MPFLVFLPALILVEELVQAAVVVGAVVVGANVAVDATRATVETIHDLTHSSSSTTTQCFEKKTIYDWWCNGLTSEERKVLLERGYSDRTSCFTLDELFDVLDRACLEKAPGKPTEKDGFKPKKGWNGKTVKAPDSKKRGYPDENDNVWVPSGKGTGVHEPHWDVEKPHGGGYDNVYPGGGIRPGKK